MYRKSLTLATAMIGLGATAQAGDISTHVLNISTGTGGAGIPVTLEMQKDGVWTEVGSGTTSENGRIEAFGIATEPALYRLNFDVSHYTALGSDPFFPQISITFKIQDAEREHHHIPILISPFGYATYLGN